MVRALRALAALLGAGVLALGCGAGTDGPTGTPSATSDDPGASPDTPAVPEAEAPGPWMPSRPLALDRFALEAAVGSALADPAGAELSDSTLWTLTGEAVELQFQVRTWFDSTEAEVQCRASAGDGAEESLALGPPVWTTADAAYVTQDSACVQIRVARGSALDGAAAAAVAAALIASG